MNTVSTPQTINLKDISTLTARLAQVLAQEADLLAAMKVKEIEALQQEKLFLVNALEAHRKLAAKHPHLIDTIPSRDKSDFEGVVAVFNDILKENHKRLAMAREVNRKVVETIAQVVKDSAKSRVYGSSGMTGAMGTQALSVTLNHTA